MKRFVLISILLLTLSAPVYADCQNGQPCGPVPWNLPFFPPLPSPTAFPTVIVTITSTPTQTLTPTPGGPPAATATPQLDTSGINNQVATLQTIIEQTPVATFSPAFGGDDLKDNSQTFFGYVLGLQDVHFGVLTPLLTFLVFSLGYTLSVKMVLMLLPVLSALFGLISKIISLILEFIPF